jgi:hypothetical protein
VEPKAHVSKFIDWNGPFGPLVAMIGCGLFALSLPPVSDHGYQFHLASRVLDGARLYVDVAAADMHPPLFTWLAIAIESAGRPIGMTGLALYPIAVTVAVSCSVYLVWRFFRPSPFLLVGLIIALLPAAGFSFGQGEHLAVSLSLPYLFAAARAVSGEPLPRGARLAFAVIAAFGFAMKPHFALVWLFVEAYVALRRGIRSLLRIDCLAIGAIFVTYTLATALVTPEFFRLLPWLMRLYPHFAPSALPRLLLDWRALLLLCGLVAGRIARRQSAVAPLADVLSLATLAMYMSLLMQLKGWAYHWQPVNALALILCGLAAEPVGARVRALTPALATAAIVTMNVQVDRTFRLLASPPTFLPELLRIADEHADRRPVVALSQYLQVGFPLVNYMHTSWASPYGHLWMVPAIYAASWYGDAPVQYRNAGEWRMLEQQVFDRLWDSIERGDPGLLVVETSSVTRFDMRAYFETDERFRTLFQKATALDTVGHHIVYALPARGPAVAP